MYIIYSDRYCKYMYACFMYVCIYIIQWLHLFSLPTGLWWAVGARETSESTWVQVQGYATQGAGNSCMAQGNPWKMGIFWNKNCLLQKGAWNHSVSEGEAVAKKDVVPCFGWVVGICYLVLLEDSHTNSVIIESLNKKYAPEKKQKNRAPNSKKNIIIPNHSGRIPFCLFKPW